MAHKEKTGTAVADVVEAVEAETPKAATTVIDEKKAPKEKKAPAAQVTRRFRLLDGVEAKDFKGQRQIVVNTLLKLAAGPGDGSSTVEEIVANAEGLVSKTPLEASVKFHLAGLIKDKQVTVVEVPVATAAVAEPVAA